RPGKLGYGSAHVVGFKRALALGAEIIVSMDADFSHQPEKIVELVRAIKSGADVAVGSRKINGGEIMGWNMWRKFASAGAMWVSKIVLKIRTDDLTSGFRAYRRSVFDKINLDAISSNGYSFLEELIYLVEGAGFRIVEVPIKFIDRQQGKSKLSKREIIKFFVTIFRIKFKFK
ncbi:MAG TPA: glycosyltransferase, partial [bacterium]|nr:glycosyltransferase [bacterium]